MPVVGAVDISVGVLTLIQPVRAVVLYMTFSGFQTACLRPLAGQRVWELLERAGNYGVPLAFLCPLGSGPFLADWFSFRPAPPLTLARAAAIGWTLRVTTHAHASGMPNIAKYGTQAALVMRSKAP